MKTFPDSASPLSHTSMQVPLYIERLETSTLLVINFLRNCSQFVILKSVTFFVDSFSRTDSTPEPAKYRTIIYAARGSGALLS